MKTKIPAFLALIIFTLTLASSALGDAQPEFSPALNVNQGSTGLQRYNYVTITSNGDYIAIWKDEVDDFIYAQKFNNSGSLAWGSSVQVTNVVAGTFYDIVADNAGGAFVAYEIGSDYHVNHIDSSGNLWTVNGVQVYSQSGDSEDIGYILHDGSGGVFASWEVDRSGTDYASITRLNSSGTVHASWNTAGSGTFRALDFSSPNGLEPKIVDDGSGNVILIAEQTTNRLVGVKLDPTGSTLWGPTNITDTAGIYDWMIISDENGGVHIGYATWDDFPYVMKIQHIDNTGSSDWTTTVGTANGSSPYPHMIEDGSGGAIMVWNHEDAGDSDVDIYGQKVNLSGTAQWNGGSMLGIAPSDATYSNTLLFDMNHSMASDGAGGAFVGFSAVGGSDPIGIQYVKSNGTLDFGSGYTTGSSAWFTSLTEDGSGGVVVVYTGDGPSSTDILAQRISVVVVTPPPTNLDASGLDGDVNLTWDDNATDEENYYLYYADNSSQPGSPTVTLPANSTGHNLSGLPLGSTYYFWVSAYDSVTGESTTDTISYPINPTTQEGAIEIHISDNGAGSDEIIGAGITNGDDAGGLKDIDFNGAPTEENVNVYGAERYTFSSGQPSRGTVTLNIEAPTGTEFEVDGGGSDLNDEDDEYSDPVPLGFTTEIYGKEVDTVVVGTNGAVFLNSSGDMDGSSTGDYTGYSMSSYDDLPSNVDGTASGDIMVAYTLTDLNPSEIPGSSIRYSTDGTAPNRRFIITFEDIEYYSPSGYPGDMEIKIYERAPATSTSTPDAPTDLATTSVSTSEIALSWTDNADNEDNYYIYYSETDSQPGAPNATIAADSNSHTISGLDSSTTYHIWISAYSGSYGESDAASINTTTEKEIILLTDKVYDPAGLSAEEFGFTVAIDGEFALVSAPEQSSGDGIVYIYKKIAGTWTEQTSVLGRSALLGYGLDLSEDYAALGGPTENSSAGIVYVNKRISDDNWNNVDTLTPADAEAGDYFGASIVVEGDEMIIGAPEYDDSGRGKAYIFRRDTGLDTWSEIKALSPLDTPNSNEFFGSSVGLSGDNTIVGISNENDMGAAYIFGRDEGGADNWGQVQKLVASDQDDYDNFGISVDIDGDYAVIGASDESSGTGSVYIFKNNAGTWTETAKITPSTSETGGYRFGRSVAIKGDYLIAGAHSPYVSGPTDYPGTTYLYKKDTGLETWTEVDKFSASDGSDFGYSVGIDESATDSTYNLIIGSTYAAGRLGDGEGAAYFYNFTPATETISSGGGGTTISCPSRPPALNLPETLEVSEENGKPVVRINWQAGTNYSSISTEQKKIDTFFGYLSQPLRPRVGKTEKTLEGIFAQYFDDRIDESENKALQETYEIEKKSNKLIQENLMICSQRTSTALISEIKRLMEKQSFQRDIKNIIIDFVDDYLDVEKHFSEQLDSRNNFNAYYEKYYSVREETRLGTSDTTVEIYRNGTRIFSQVNPMITSFTDEDVPENETGRVQKYNYYIKTKNRCYENTGSEGKAFINPKLTEDTDIYAKANIKIKVKEGYDILFKEKLTKLVETAREKSQTEPVEIHADSAMTTRDDQDCSETERKVMKDLNSETLMDYILACYSTDDITENLKERQAKIIPPLLLKLRLDQNKNRTDIIDEYMESIIDDLKKNLSTQDEVFGLTGGDIRRIDPEKEIDEYTSSEKELIMCGGIENCDQTTKDKIEAYFEGSSHAKDIIIELYDSEENLVYSTESRTNIFGEVRNVSLGKILAGREYIIKIRLKNERFVLPKISDITINTALPQDDSSYQVTMNLSYPEHFRYGNFDESDDIINLKDILAWGNLIQENPGLWEASNLDGLYGVDLLDVITLQENWGDNQKVEIKGKQISINELAKILGLPELFRSKGTVNAPEWTKLIEYSCEGL